MQKDTGRMIEAESFEPESVIIFHWVCLRARLETRFGVPPLVGTSLEPPKGGTSNPRPRIPGGFFKHALEQFQIELRTHITK